MDETDKKVASVNNNSSTLLRCYNCNSKGHWAKECRKPKRVKGSCYACGEMGHFAAKCLKNKNGDENNYHAS
ncbi:zinc finger protein GIS2-like [Drosophila sechellia]|uniref:zinc finger protein GIS2-like n=1 Tax=Drosophila sechellia TaxID=7238 RepID=UPI0013DDF954|nr:zinc finger protein GIS2-like [Drosophila sechellia]XP_032583075.1 zinc finger protein GIS2-like [Drosophila sechellia]